MIPKVTVKQLNPHNYSTTKEIEDNLSILAARINGMLAIWGKEIKVTSGLRSEVDQKRINPSAPKSKHLIGAAVDISDPKGELAAWILTKLDLMATIGLWFEDFRYTKGWIHAQIVPPKSGKRVFIP